MRIKILKAVPKADGSGVYQPGEFLTVENEAVAQQYVECGYAEAAPDLPDLATEMKTLFVDALRTAISEVAPAQKSKGPAVPGWVATESEQDKQKSFGHQLKLIGTACHPDTPPHQRAEANETLGKVYGSRFREWGAKASVQVESSGPLGGYGVYPEFSNQIFKIAIEQTLLASRARKIPMSSNELRYPKLDQTSTATANTYTGYLGGVIAGWSGETKTPPQTNAKLKQGVLKAGELMGYTQISNELLADNSVGLESMVTSLFAEAIAYYTDLATLVGDGVDKPQGVVGANASIVVTRGTSSQINFVDLVTMKSKLLPESARRAFWIFNQTAMPQLYQMKDASNRLIVQPYMPSAKGGPATVDLPETILGLPLYFTEKTPPMGTKGDVILVDPQGYLLGERMALEIAASPHVAFLAREMTYRFVARVAGQTVLDAPFTMLDGTNQLSTFAVLNT